MSGFSTISKRVSVIALSFGLVAALAGGAAAADRSTLPPVQSQNAVAYQINNAHSGNITLTGGFATPLTKLWSINLGGAVSYPVIAMNMAFVTVGGNLVFAINLATGATVWEKTISGGWSAAAYDARMLFVINNGGTLQGFKAGSGKSLWAVQLPGQYSFSSPPVAANGQVFTGGAGSGGTLYGVDELTGNVQWMQSVANGDDSSPALGGGGVYVTYPCQYYSFAPANGAPIWHDSNGCDGGGGNTPVYFKKRLYIQDWTSGDYVLNAKTGALITTYSSGPTPALFTDANRNSFLLTVSNGKLYCSNIKTGNVAWTFTGDGALSTSAIVVNGLVVIGSSAGNLYVVDGGTGSQDWTDNVGSAMSASLAAGQGTLVVPAGNTLTAYKPN